ncbi:HIT family protein [Salinirubellus salinus]|uniref:HIT family protein n=1 Tax=Salinirubellus salinus TaxID=1364945 RepID=A0A9E7R0I0_9EURY|nr:HIT family protein [Salinirubellus salinus]UWM53414.1 HIT family protein [Salinirubellus salinus]
MTDCVFCSIVAEDSPAYRLYEDEHTLAFLDIEPATRGHTLVIPKTHYETTTDMPESLAGRVFETVHHVAAALETAYGLDGFALVQENGVTAEQDVPHAHVHILPRYGDDALDLGWNGERVDETTQQEVAATVRDELMSGA